MKKGLITLMTVAFALVSVQAMATAPTIYDLPTVIIGNQAAGASQTAPFVYGDAFDLNQYVFDNETTDVTKLQWSYEIFGTPKYKINGDDPINSTTEWPNPPAAKRINVQMNGIGGTTSELNPDGKANTITIRNVSYKPFSGTGATATITGTFVDNQAVTFWCSDGSLASSRTVSFWTDMSFNGTNNRLSVGSQFKPVVQEEFAGKFWGFYSGDLKLGSVTTGTWAATGKGMCFTVTQRGDNMASVISPTSFFQLAKNKVYRVRAKMNCSQSTPGKTPFWNLILDNWNGDATKGMNLYGMDTYFLDNSGSANAVLNTAGGTNIDLYWAPLAFQTPQWNNTTTGLFTTANDAKNDPFVRFRVMDLDSAAGLGNETKFGSICLQSLSVSSIDYTAQNVSTVATVVNIGQIGTGTKGADFKGASNTVTGGNAWVTSFVAATVQYTTLNGVGSLRITPAGTGITDELVTVVPASDQRNTLSPPWSNLADDWPITWKSGKIYQMDMELYAPDSNSSAHPWDVIWMHMESPTNEINHNSFVTAYLGIGSPKVYNAAAPQVYTYFYNSLTETASSTPTQLHALRWRVRFGNGAALRFPNGTSDTTNVGGVVIRGITIKEVKFN